MATTAEELATLEDIERRARANGAGAIELLDGAQVRREQPRVFAHAALRSPESGIVDAHALTQSYQAELEAHAGQVVTRTCVVGLARSRTGWSLETRGPDSAGSFTVQAEGVINAAGLEADRIAALAGLEIDRLGYRLHPCKGDYFSVVPALGALTETLVYPVPEPGGLGIHITMDLAGRFRLGPDVEYVAQPRYEVDPDKAGAFASAVCRYLPEIRAEHLAPDFAGVRPKLQGPDEPFRDFVIAEESSRGLPGLIDLIGIESPGLTAAGEIAERVADLV